MSRTYKHILNAKFNNGIIKLKDVPFFLIQYWNRHNFWTGENKYRRKEYFAKLKKEEINEDNSSNPSYF